MKIPSEGTLLRIFVDETDKWHGQPLYEAIIYRARKEGMAGATAIRGILGFGAKSRMHEGDLARVSSNHSIIIEIVDSKEKIQQFLESSNEMVKEGLITVEKAQVIKYQAEPNQGS